MITVDPQSSLAILGTNTQEQSQGHTTTFVCANLCAA